MSPRNLTTKIALVLLACGAIASPALAAEMSHQQIIEKLKTPKLTRSLSGPATAAPAPAALSPSELSLINRVRKTRSLSSGDRQQITEIAKSRPTIDLEINFEYNSAAVSPSAESQLHNLGKALTSSELAGSVFMLGGHTDARGSDTYNQKLSERRAETVKAFLISTYRIPAENLVSAGYGESELKNKADPNAAENRRVQVVNMAQQEQASR